MMMEMMGLHDPAESYVNPGTRLRQELTRAAVHRVTQIGWNGDDYRPIGHCVDEKAIINACIGLLATGGSTNHAIHLPAIARAAGVLIDWEDLNDLSAIVPMLARVYPNGSGDVNHFHAAGGIGFVIRELAHAGLLHTDIMTVSGTSLLDYATEPSLDDAGRLTHHPAPAQSRDTDMLRPVAAPFQPDGGMRLLTGNLGRAVIKTSAVDPFRWIIEAPARIFDDQDAVRVAFQAGELDRDVVVVVRFQGPRANGMPELHKLTPPLGVLQDRGHRVALVTDGRMSGASGKVPAAIHCWPEAGQGGPLARLQDGDVVRVDAVAGTLTALVDAAEWAGRRPASQPAQPMGTGRELFAIMRATADNAEAGACGMLVAAGL
jgi:phosphogluconate dehydratase